MGTRSPLPQRTCVVCGSKAPKQELLRVVANAAGSVTLDLSGKAQGRGAYVCRRPDCEKDNLRSQRLGHALRCKISESDWKQLLASLKDAAVA
ncbi:MAG: YlxR family protein [SAR202 cluster bacterium]|nr:YlxR family protein [SAR202 cluster bacterium]